MTQWARDNGWDAPPEAGAKELAAAAAAGDAVALRAFERGATAVAAMIASVGAVCDLELASSAVVWPSPAHCCSTRCGRRSPATPGWTSSPT